MKEAGDSGLSCQQLVIAMLPFPKGPRAPAVSRGVCMWACRVWTGPAEVEDGSDIPEDVCTALGQVLVAVCSVSPCHHHRPV